MLRSWQPGLKSYKRRFQPIAPEMVRSRPAALDDFTMFYAERIPPEEKPRSQAQLSPLVDNTSPYPGLSVPLVELAPRRRKAQARNDHRGRRAVLDWTEHGGPKVAFPQTHRAHRRTPAAPTGLTSEDGATIRARRAHRPELRLALRPHRGWPPATRTGGTLKVPRRASAGGGRRGCRWRGG